MLFFWCEFSPKQSLLKHILSLQRELKVDEKITEFYKQLQYLMAEHETEELTNASLIQEFISLSVTNACIVAVDTDQVDWTIRYVKKEALKLREEMEEA